MTSVGCLPAVYCRVECPMATLSFGSNALLVLLVIFRTPPELRPYSRVLLCHSFVDLIFTTSSFVIDLVIFYSRISFSVSVFTFSACHCSQWNARRHFGWLLRQRRCAYESGGVLRLHNALLIANIYCRRAIFVPLLRHMQVRVYSVFIELSFSVGLLLFVGSMQ